MNYYKIYSIAFILLCMCRLTLNAQQQTNVKTNGTLPRGRIKQQFKVILSVRIKPAC